MLLPLALLLAAVQAVRALTASQLSAVFSNTTGLSGTSTQLPSFDLTVVTNSTHALFVVNLTSTSPESVGWIGIGHGSAMANADFLVAWPTVSSSSTVNWALSHRLPNSAAPQSHAEPEVASTTAGSSTDAYYTLVPALSTSEVADPSTSVAWLRPLVPPSGYPASPGRDANLQQAGENQFIYASSSRNPGTSDEGSAELEQHDQPHGTTTLSLAALANLDAGDPSSAGDSSSSVVGSSSSQRGRTTNDKKLIAHATLGSLAVLLFSPLAILLARLGRDRFAWLPSHYLLNGLAVVLVIVAFALGTDVAGGEWDDFHKRLGLALLLLFLLQPLLGALSHFLSPASPLTSSRPSAVLAPRLSPLRAIHILLGVVTVALGWTQVASGIYREWPKSSDAQSKVPKGVKVVFWLLVGIGIAAYFGVWAWQVVRRKRGVAGTGGGDGTEEGRRRGRGEKRLMSGSSGTTE
ncbi:hypothetical protein JCM8097_005704 [Rhodosporidiobolus ruineniae]